MTQPSYQGFDPQVSYTSPQWEVLRCCLLRTLMTYRGLPGSEGTKLYPDLAAAPPSVSSDGLTWTFRLKRGIHYAPPLEDVEIKAQDIVRALLRSGSPDVPFNAGVYYLTLVEGFDEYAAGEAESIAGVSTPDDYTLQIRETRPDASIVHLFAMAFSAPIPPQPGDPEATFGVAEGHPFEVDDSYEQAPTKIGYGPFLVASGPYMIEGAPEMDLTLPPEERTPAQGFTPAWSDVDEEIRGSLTLVRNPSWDRATDPNRAALPDRIEVVIQPADESLFDALTDGSVDVTLGRDHPPDVIDRLRSAGETAGLVVQTPGPASSYLAMNVAQPPFDDVHVRRALAFALDRSTLPAAPFDAGSVTSHLVPDPMEGSFLSAWDPFTSVGSEGNLEAARAEMDASRYGRKGRCAAPECDRVLLGLYAGESDPRPIQAALESLGISSVVRELAPCAPEDHIALCMAGWQVDYPDAGNFFVPHLSGQLTPDQGASLLGASPEDLREWKYDVREVPSIDQDYSRCAAQVGIRATICWARLDQLLVGTLAAVIPLVIAQTVRIQGVRVTSYSMDQAFGEPSLDRIVVEG